jgi:hypothetical protein
MSDNPEFCQVASVPEGGCKPQHRAGVELFDLQKDPREQVNLIEQERTLGERMLGLLELQEQGTRGGIYIDFSNASRPGLGCWVPIVLTPDCGGRPSSWVRTGSR